jgi:hypothetical protein
LGSNQKPKGLKEITLKIPKITAVAFGVFIGITVLMIALPIFEINSLTASITANPDIPSYKFTESINLWKLYQVTAFQPASYIFLIVTIIIGIVFGAQIVQMNYKLQPKDNA